MRSNFPVLNSCIYFNNAYAGPISISLSEHRKKIEKKLLKDVDGFKIDNPIELGRDVSFLWKERYYYHYFQYHLFISIIPTY